MKTSQVQRHDLSLESLLRGAEHVLSEAAESHEPAQYHLKAGGQRMRMRACLEACLTLNINRDDSLALAASIELLHNASLIHDDLQDRDTVRRGRPTVWSKYGDNIAICSGDYLLTKAFGVLATHGRDLPLTEIIYEVQQAVSQTINGQCEDVRLVDTDNAQRYETIAAGKSGPLIALPLVLPLITADRREHVEQAKRAIRFFAIAYQIVDDIGDWKEDALNKHLNVVNIHRKNHSLEQSISLATDRAAYLLKRCEQDLDELPSACARGIKSAVAAMREKLEAASND